MPRRRRSTLGTTCFHILNRSARKIKLFQKRQDYSAFVDVLADGLKRHPVRLVGYCLMPNHWHLVLGPADPSAVSQLLHWVTTTHAIRWQRHRKTVGLGPVYQGRFKCQSLEAMEQLMRACRYVERNALSAR